MSPQALQNVTALWKLRYFGVFVYLTETLRTYIENGKLGAFEGCVILAVCFVVFVLSGAWQSSTQGEKRAPKTVEPLAEPLPLGLNPEQREVLDAMVEVRRKGLGG